MITAVIPMAGESRRFKLKGIQTSKPFLHLPDGRSLLDAVLDSLPVCDMVITVGRFEDMREIEARKHRAIFPVWVKRETAGPIDTMLEAKELLRNNHELLINYCDCFLPDGQAMEFVEKMRALSRLAGVVCFPSNDSRFQREPTGRFAMSGIFYFKRSDSFERQARHIRSLRSVESVSPAEIAFSMKFLGLNSSGVYVTDNIIDLGVPESYNLYCSLMRARLKQEEA